MTTRDEPETPASVARMRRIVGHIAGIPTSTAAAPSASSSSSSLVQGSSATRWNGWGYEDTKLFVNAAGAIEILGHRYADVFHGAADRTLPLLRPWAERVIGLDVSRTSRALNTKADAFQIVDPQFSEHKQHALKSFLEKLEASGVRVSVAMEDRVRHSHGQTCEEIYRLRNATHLGRIPDAVVWPSSHAHVARIVAEVQAQSDALCLVPHGGGTNVSTALQCNAQEARAIVSLDVRNMKRILLVDKENMVVRAEAGITGLELHERLRNKGLTLGHEPDSWEFSTLGGWVATKASGMKKNLYGNIEDLVVNITMVTPRGTLQRAASVPRVSMGPDIQQALIGSEGTLGVVTEVTLRVRAYPSCQVYDSLVFPSLAHGIDAMREIVRAQCVPASIRLLDNTQFQLGQALKPSTPSGFLTGVLDFAKKTYVTKVRGFDGTQMCAATVLFEGTEEQVQRQQKQIQAIATRFHGLVGGAESGQRGYFFTYIIAYLRDFALDYYFMSESFETAVPWSNIQQLCEDVTRAITTTANAHHTLVAQPLVACRVTQLYETGAAVYVYYGINYFGIADPLALFHRVEQAAVEAIVANGGSLSHHHGIGQHRRAWLPDAISAPGVAALRGLKQGLDPQNVFAVDNLVVRE